jgi:hypothetical protein
MATIVFSGGHELPVREDFSHLNSLIDGAESATASTPPFSRRNLSPSTPVLGWFLVTPEESPHEQVMVNPHTIAYVRP